MRAILAINPFRLPFDGFYMYHLSSEHSDTRSPSRVIRFWICHFYLNTIAENC